MLCKSLFAGSTHHSQRKILERATKKINDSLEIKQIIRYQEMTKILVSGLLSKQSALLAKLQTSPQQLLNQSDSAHSDDPSPVLTPLVGWQPKNKLD